MFHALKFTSIDNNQVVYEQVSRMNVYTNSLKKSQSLDNAHHAKCLEFDRAYYTGLPFLTALQANVDLDREV